jgi:peptidoglycan/LPS O-acetylase OafA/YrhL
MQEHKTARWRKSSNPRQAAPCSVNYNSQCLQGRHLAVSVKLLSNDRQPAIDLLRIIAAAVVVGFHYLYLFPNNGTLPHVAVHAVAQRIAAHGYLGVELFFMISGYVIALSAEGRTRLTFAYARAVRLWPAFLMCLVLTVGASLGDGQDLTAAQIGANLTMLPKLFSQPYLDEVYWSLMFEVIFYVGVTVFVISPNFLRRLRLFTVAWLLVSAIAPLVVPISAIRTLLALEFAPYFAIGIGIFLLHRCGYLWRDRALALGSVAMAAACAAGASQAVGEPFEITPRQGAVAAIVVLSAVMVCLAPMVCMGPRAARICVALGGVSYPLYLLHSQLGAILIRWSTSFASAAGAVVLITGGIVALSFAIWRMEVAARDRLMRRDECAWAILHGLLLGKGR